MIWILILDIDMVKLHLFGETQLTLLPVSAYMQKIVKRKSELPKLLSTQCCVVKIAISQDSWNLRFQLNIVEACTNVHVQI